MQIKFELDERQRFILIALVLISIIIFIGLLAQRQPNPNLSTSPEYIIYYSPDLQKYSVQFTGEVDDPSQVLDKIREDLNRLGVNPDDSSLVSYDLEGIYLGKSQEQFNQIDELGIEQQIQESIEQSQIEQDLLDGKFYYDP